MKNHTPLLLSFFQQLFFQNTSVKAPGVMQEVSSAAEDFFLPRMATAQKNTIPSLPTALTLFNTTGVVYLVSTGTSEAMRIDTDAKLDVAVTYTSNTILNDNNEKSMQLLRIR